MIDKFQLLCPILTSKKLEVLKHSLIILEDYLIDLRLIRLFLISHLRLLIAIKDRLSLVMNICLPLSIRLKYLFYENKLFFVYIDIFLQTIYLSIGFDRVWE